MKNKKLFHACMAGFLGAALLMTSVPAMAADFQDDAEAQSAMVDTQEQPEEDVSAEDVFEAEPAAETFSAASPRAASAGLAISKTYFPDANFRAFVSTLDKDNNKSLSTSEIAAVKSIDVSGQGISNLKGIERFTALTKLDASDNKLTSIGLTKNTKLAELNLSGNKLTAADLTRNTKLVYINLSKNSLKGTLNLSKCTAMSKATSTIVCSSNALTKITMPNVKYLKKLDYIGVAHNKFTTQGNAGLGNISATYLPGLSEVDASYNSISTFNCSGFEGILDITNNRITTLTGGAEGYQAAAIYLEGKSNTLSKTKAVDFASLGNRVPQRFSCNAAVRGKVSMIVPRLSAKVQSSLDQIKVSFGSTSDYATYRLERKDGSGAYRVIAEWNEGDLDDPEFGADNYPDNVVSPGAAYTYRLTATVKVQDKARNEVPWSKSKTVTVKAVPGTPTLTVKSTAKKVANLSWKAVSGATGYDVYFGTSKTKQTGKVVTGTAKYSVNKTKLVSGRTYYFKMRAYKTVNNKKIYGNYSSVKYVKVR